MTKTLDILGRAVRAACIVLLLTGTWPSAAVGQALAPSVQPGASAPTLNAAGNGVPIVTITTPNAAGVSHNQFEAFNVGPQGLILNNSQAIVSTQLAGYIDGNANLKASGPARLILNEITSANPTLLKGYMEVAGQAAQVVVANPYGVTCSGCGFINTPYATLSTGTPFLNGVGALGGYDVAKGELRIEGLGLDGGSADRVDLIARAMTLNAGVWAKEINGAFGSGQVDALDFTSKAVAPTGPRPQFGLDVAAIGGMYARSIRLIGTEAGLGVRIDGDLASMENPFTLTTDGGVKITGRVASASDLTLKAGEDLTVDGSLYAKGQAQVAVGGRLDNQATIAAQGDLDVRAGQLSSTGVLAAGVTDDGQTTGASKLTVVVDGGAKLSQALGSKSLSITAGALDVSQVQLSGPDGVTLAATSGDLNTSGAKVVTPGTLTVSAAGALINAAGHLQGDVVNAKAGTLRNGGGVITQTGDGDGAIEVGGDLDNQSGQIASQGALSIQSGDLDNRGGQITALGDQGLTIVADGAVDNRASLIGGNGSVAVQGRSIDNSAQGKITAGGSLTVTAAAGDLRLDNGGELSAKQDLTASATGVIDVTKALIQGAGTVGVQAGVLKLDQGVLNAGALNITAGDILNRAGKISQTGAAASSLVASRLFDNTGGMISVNADSFTLGAGAFANGGGRVSHAGTGTLTLAVGGLFENAGGQFASSGTVTGQVGALSNAAGKLTALGDIALTIDGAVDNKSGVIAAGGGLSLLAAGALDNSQGLIEGGGAVRLEGASLANTGGKIHATGSQSLTVNVGGTLNNRGGLIAGMGDVSVTGGDVDNSGAGSRIAAGGKAAISATSGGINLSGGGQAAAGGDLSLNAASKIDLSSGGDVQAAGLATIKGASVVNDGGKVTAGGLDLTAETLSNRSGQIVLLGSGASTVKVAGAVDNTDGVMSATAGALAVSAGTLDNTRGQIVNAGGGELSVTTTGQLNNASGKIGSNGDLKVATANLVGPGGQLTAVRDASLSVTGDLKSAGIGIAAGRSLSIATTGVFDNAGGEMVAAGALNVTAASVLNTGGKMLAAGTQGLSVKATGLVDNRGGVIGANGAVLIEGGSVDSSGAGSQITSQGPVTVAASQGDIVLANGGKVVSGGDLKLGADGVVDLSGGAAQGAGLVTVAGGLLKTDGGLLAGDSLKVDVGALSNLGGQILAVGAATQSSVTVAGALDNTGGVMTANGGQLAVSAADIKNADGAIGTAGLGDLKITTGAGLDNRLGKIVSGGTLDLSAAVLKNAGGQIGAGGAAAVQTSGGFDNAGGVLAGGQSLTIQSQGLNNAGGTVQSAGALNLTVAEVQNTGGLIAATGAHALTMNAIGMVNNRGGQIGAQSVTINAAAIDTGGTGGKIAAQGELGLTTLSGGISADQGGLIIAGGAVNVASASGLNLTQGQLQAGGALEVLAAGDVVNDAGQLSAASLNIQAASLSNKAGLIVAADAAAASQLAVAGQIDNTGGVLSAGGSSLTLTGQGLTNIGGQVLHTGAGPLSIAVTDTADNSAGVVATNGALTVSAAALNNVSGKITSVGDQSFTLGQLDNTKGQTASGGAAVFDIAGGLINDQGAIDAVSLTIDADSISNAAGRMVGSGAGPMTVATTGAISSQGGLIGGGGALTVSAASLDVGGAGGRLIAGSDLAVTTGIGAISAAGGGAIAAGGSTILNAVLIDASDGGMIQAGGSAVLNAQALKLDAGGKLQADVLSLDMGMLSNRGGVILQTGFNDLELKADLLDNTGGTIAANAARLKIVTPALINTLGVIQHAGTQQLDLQVAGGLANGGGKIVTNGELTLAAQAITGAAGALTAVKDMTLAVNDNADLSSGAVSSGGALSLTAGGELKLTNGAVQAAAGAAITAAVINGQGGQMLSTGAQALNVTALSGAIDMRGGVIGGGGDVAVTATAVDVGGSGGRLIANGDLAVTATTGSVSAAGGGVIAAKNDLTINAVAGLDASGGVVQAVGKATIDAPVITLDNGGALSAGQLVMTADAISNKGGSIIQTGAADLVLAMSQLDNTGGTIAANAANMTVTAADLTNLNGTIEHAGVGALAIQTDDAFKSAGGKIITKGTLAIDAASLDLSAAQVSAQTAASLTATAGEINAVNGKIISGGALNFSSTGAVLNAGGDIGAGSTLTINAASVGNAAGKLVAYGGDGLKLTAGEVTNTAGGLLGANGAAQLNTATLRNSGGSISAGALALNGLIDFNNDNGKLQSGSALSFTASGTFSNRSGVISADQGLTFNVGALDNTSGVLNSIGGLVSVIASGAINNSGGKIGGQGISLSGEQINNQGGVIASQGELTIATTGALNNASGQIYGQGVTMVSSVSLDNTNGQLGAGGDLRLITGAVSNSGGKIAANNDAVLNISSINGGGMAAGRDLTVNASGALTIGSGAVAAAGRALSISSGSLTNNGSIQGQSVVLNTSGQISNASSGSIQGTSVTAQAGGVLDNRGLINGSTVDLYSDTSIVNRSRIYGSTVKLATYGAVTNNAGAIAASSNLTLQGNGGVTNTSGGTLFSVGNISISGMGGSSTGQFTNYSSDVNAYGNININASNSSNTRAQFTIQSITTTKTGVWIEGDTVCTATNNCHRTYKQDTFVTTNAYSTARSTIVAGGNLTFGGDVLNYASTISAGGRISAGYIDNRSFTFGTQQTRHAIDEWNVVDCDHYADPVKCNGGAYNGAPAADDGFNFNGAGNGIIRWVLGSGSGIYVAPEIGGRNHQTWTGYTWNQDGVAVVNGASVHATSIANVNLTAPGAPAASSSVHSSAFATMTGGAAANVAKAAASSANTSVEGVSVGGAQVAAGSAAVGVVEGSSVRAVSAAQQTTSGSTAVAGGGSVAGVQNAALSAVPSAVTGGQAVGAVTATAGRVSTNSIEGQKLEGAALVQVASNGGGVTSKSPTLNSGVFTVKTGGLFVAASGPQSKYLVETDPKFTDYHKFISSDYFFQKAGIDLSAIEKRLGDGLYEQQLIQKQLMQQTGGAFVGSGDQEAQYRALMDAGVAYMQAHNIGFGVSLSAAQMAALTTNMVLMEYQTVDTPDGPQRVLVPVVYLTKASQIDLTHGGSLIAANDIEVDGGSFVNEGSVLAANSARINVAEFSNIGQVDLGTLGSIKTTGDLTNAGSITGSKFNIDSAGSLSNLGAISGADFTLHAANDITNAGSITGSSFKIDAGISFTNTGGIGGTGFTITAANDINNSGLITGTNFGLAAANVSNSGEISGTNFTVKAGAGLSNTGQIAGAGFALTAGEDIANTGVIGGLGFSLNAGRDLLNTGSIGGGAFSLNAANDVINSGSVTGTDFALNAGRDLINQGQIAGGALNLIAGRELALGGSVVSTQHLGLQTGGDIALGTLLTDNLKIGGGLTAVAGQNLSVAGMSMDMAGSLILKAGGDLDATAANLKATGGIGLSAGNDLLLGAVQNTTASSSNYGGTAVGASTTTHQTTQLSAGGNIVLAAGGDLTAQGAQVKADGVLDVRAGGTIDIASVTDSRATDTMISGKKHSEHTQKIDETVQGSVFSGAQGVTMAAGLTDKTAELIISGSQVSSTDGAVKLAGAGGVSIEAAYETHYSLEDTTDVKKKLLSKKTTTSHEETYAANAIGSLVSGQSVSIASGGDLSVLGSNIVATDNVALSAVGDVDIAAARNYADSDSAQSVKKSGLSISLSGIFLGTSKSSSTEQEQGTTSVASLIGSTDGNVSITAGQSLDVAGSIIKADKGDLALAGKEVAITAAQTDHLLVATSKTSQTGLTLGVQSPLLNAASTIGQMADAAGQVDDPRLLALAGATTGLAAYNAATALQNGSIGSVSLTFGSSSSSSSMTTQSLTNTGSVLTAGGSASIIATGTAGVAGSGDLTLSGSTLNAGGNVLLSAADALTLTSVADTYAMEQTSKSSSFGVGVQASVGQNTGVSAIANASATKSSANAASTTQVATAVNAGGALTLLSGGDTSLIGASATGAQVTAIVGGDLTLTSLQDTDTYRSSSQSLGGSLSVGAGTVGGGLNYGQTKLASDYAAVTTQAGLYAGAGGFQVEVGGNTALTGAVIASTADASHNSLTTATLTVGDIANSAAYSGSQLGLGVGLNGQSGKNGEVTTGGGGFLPGLGGLGGLGGLTAGLPTALTAKDSASSTTQSAISAGSVTITDAAGQQALTGQTADQTLASLNRDASDTLGALKPIFDQQQVEAGFAITAAFGQQTGQFLADKAQAAAKEAAAKEAAAKQAEAAGDPARAAELRAQAAQTQAEWGPGSTNRQLLTAVVAAASGNVTGSAGEMLKAGLVNVIQQKGAEEIGKLAHSGAVTEGSPEHTALQAIIGCAGAAAGGSSCSSGAMGAAASVVITKLLDDHGADLDSNDPEAAQKAEARRNLVATLVTGLAATGGLDTTAAATAALAEVDNNGNCKLCDVLAMMKKPQTPEEVLDRGGSREEVAEASGRTIVYDSAVKSAELDLKVLDAFGWVSGAGELAAAGFGVNSLINITKDRLKGIGTNPFIGKSADEIVNMFTKKGFVPKGPNPAAGEGTFVNLQTGRSYHLDLWHPEPKGPHVGVQRPRGSRDLPPKDYPAGGN